jgi:prolyl-tRNA synthetase
MQRLSEHFPQTRRADDKESVAPGHALLEQAGFVRSTGAAGIFTLLPAGWRVHRKICDVIFAEMEAKGVQNLQLPILQPRELWERSGRWENYVQNKVMFQTVEEHRGTEFGLAPTAEEVVTALVAGDVKSWRELPLRLHQIGPKFRDEIRPRLGLLRCREFTMSDAYSFDRDERAMQASFEVFKEIYERIFARLGLRDVISVEADSGPIGGKGSAEFMIVNDVGEDTLIRCDVCGYGANAEVADVPPLPDRSADAHLAVRELDCPKEGCAGTLEQRRGIEIGHIFLLQQGYAKALGAQYTTEDGLEEAMWMGCYGMGTTRLLQAIAEQAHDDHGLVWPASVAPYDMHVVLTQPEEQREMLAQLERLAGELGLIAIVDERDARPGVKFKDADLLGCPVRVTVGRKAQEGVVEMKRRGDADLIELSVEELARRLRDR